MELHGLENFSLTFTAQEGELFRCQWQGKTVALAQVTDGEAAISLWYDWKEEPLVLRGKAATGDSMRWCVSAYRLELHCNGRLMDEEWPCGSHKLQEATWESSVEIALSAWDPKGEPQPSVLGCFEQAEGWMPGGAVYVGDCMPYTCGDRYHVIYLKDRHRHHSKWGLGAHQWAHISTDDLYHWQMHPLLVEIEAPDEGSICTGSWIEHAGKQYLYYTIRSCDGSPARVCRSVSEDGYHFEKDWNSVFYINDEKYTASSARDPKVVRGANGKFHLIMTTSLRREKKGCLLHLISEDLEKWQEAENPIYVASDENEPECPDYFEKDGWYYLIFSHHGQGQYLYSDRPFDGWRKPKNPVIPCKTVPKMAIFEGRILFAGFDGSVEGGGYAGTMTFMEAKAEPDGELSFFTPDFAKRKE